MNNKIDKTLKPSSYANQHFKQCDTQNMIKCKDLFNSVYTQSDCVKTIDNPNNDQEENQKPNSSDCQLSIPVQDSLLSNNFLMKTSEKESTLPITLTESDFQKHIDNIALSQNPYTLQQTLLLQFQNTTLPGLKILITHKFGRLHFTILTSSNKNNHNEKLSSLIAYLKKSFKDECSITVNSETLQF